MFRDLSTSIFRIKKLFSKVEPTAGLAEILEQSNAITSLDDRILWFEDLLIWLKKGADQRKYTRIKFLNQILQKNPELRNSVAKQILLLIDESSMLRLLSQTGYSEHHGLLQETGRRLILSIIPSVRQNNFLEITKVVFTSDEDILWLKEMNREVLIVLSGLFTELERAQLAKSMLLHLSEAVLVFAGQISTLGLTQEIRSRMSERQPSKSPFFKLNLLLSNTQVSYSEKLPEIRSLFKSCRTSIEAIYHQMEKQGTSVGLVYRLEVMTAGLDRLEIAVELLTTSDSSTFQHRAHALLAEGVAGALESRSVIGHLRQQTHLLSRKIAERNGESSEHYIARSKSERMTLFYSALKGGLIVLVMTAAKIGIHEVHSPPLIEAIIVWFIYSFGFLAMQFTDSTLATKLPSFTASKLASLMNEVREVADLDNFVDELKQVIYSQALAFAGNMFAVGAFAMLFHYLFELTFNTEFMSEPSARLVLSGLDPVSSPTIILGALTGVLLWISSIAGGWFENWVVYQKIPLAIEHHRKLNRVFGAVRAKKFGQWIENNASGISANIVLGYLFGFVPFIGVVTGIFLDTKHVTISSTSAVLAAHTVFGAPDFAHTLSMVSIGLFFVGVMNLFVSFALALVVAARASSVDPRRFKVLLKLISRRIFWFRK